MSPLPTPSSRPNSETEPFWAAAAEGRLVLPVCDACGHHIWYPRSWCPVCGGGTVTWTELSGAGTVYACTVIRRGMGPWADATPYVVAYVELAEGPRLLTNVITDDPESVHIGLPVAATFVEVPDADQPQSILRFTPAS
jgi:uncharacterized OB-fold protein